MKRRGRVRVWMSICAIAGATVAAACGGSRGSGEATSGDTATSVAAVTESTTPPSTAPTTTLPGTPTITVFEVPRGANCRGGMRTASVALRYETVSAVAVVLLVDGIDPEPQTARPTSGSPTLELPCDGRPHRVGIRAAGANGTNAEQERVVAP